MSTVNLGMHDTTATMVPMQSMVLGRLYFAPCYRCPPSPTVTGGAVCQGHDPNEFVPETTCPYCGK